jgi:predicted PurR-regulated permease PerM
MTLEVSDGAPEADGVDAAAELSDGTESPEAPEPAAAAAEAGAPAPARRVPPVIVPRWIQLVLLPLALLALWAAAQAAGRVIVIFIAAGVIALLLNPLVNFVQRSRAPRGVCVLAVYLSFFLLLSGIVALLVNPVSSQVQNLQRDIPSLVKSANKSLSDLQHYLDRNHVGIHIQSQGQTALQTLQKSVLRSSGSIVSTTRDLVATLVSGAFALVLVIVVSVYFLLYAADIGRLVRRVMPSGDGTPEDDYPLGVQRAVFSYMRGQALFSLVMGTTAGVALWIFGVIGVFPDGRTYALFFGAFFGLMELIPYVGPVIGPLPAILVALFQDPLTALWLVILFIAIQQLEGHVVAPQVFSFSLRINPLLVIFALLFGTEVYGIVGALLALPIAAVVRETVVYLQRHLVLEPWNVVAPESAGGPAPPVGLDTAAPAPAPAKPATEPAAPRANAPG